MSTVIEKAYEYDKIKSLVDKARIKKGEVVEVALRYTDMSYSFEAQKDNALITDRGVDLLDTEYEIVEKRNPIHFQKVIENLIHEKTDEDVFSFLQEASNKESVLEIIQSLRKLNQTYHYDTNRTPFEGE